MEIKTKRIHIDRLETILDSLVGLGLETADLLLPLVGKFLSIRNNSYKKVRARISGDTYYLEKRARIEQQRAEQQRLQSSLQYLKQQGFVTREGRRHSFFWSLTEKGRSHLESLKIRRMRYKKEKTDKTIIVSYDIPENNRNNRDWVREVLRILDFSMVHKSVWIGNHKIPGDFLQDLKRKEIFAYVHIFEVGERGTLLKLQ